MKKRSFLLVSLMLFTMLQQTLAMQNLVKAPTGSNIPIEMKPTDIIENGGAEAQEENTQSQAAETSDNITYTILSEDDKTAYVSRFYFENDDIPAEGLSIEIPETVEINGETYTVVQFGKGNSGELDNFKCYNNNAPLSITFPKTIIALGYYSLDMIHGSLESTTFIFKNENAPLALSDDPNRLEIYCRGNVYVPYGAEEAYKAKFIKYYAQIQSRHTDLNIADGTITVNGNRYTQGYKTGTIDETLVIYGENPTSETTNKIVISGRTETIRVALKDVNINRTSTTSGTTNAAVSISGDVYVDMIIQGENTLRGGVSSAGLRVPTTYDGAGNAEISTLNICQLSTGVLNTYGGSEVKSDGGGAGIGGNVYENPGNIFINAGTIYAEGHKGGAGIGGGWIWSRNSNTLCGRIAINGGKVTAKYGGDGVASVGGISVGASVGSPNNYLRFYASEGTFEGNLKDNVIITDADGNFSAKATVYRGNADSSEEEIASNAILEDNTIAFTDNPALGDFVPNVVVHYGSSYGQNTCHNLNLVEGKPFYTPEDFKAEKASFTVNTDENFVYADGTNGWHTLCLPFSGNFYADDESITPFKSDEDTEGMFWLKTFSGEADSDVLGFDYATSVEAGKPYIYTIPGDKWGKEHSMTGKQISVRATNTSVSMTLNNATGTAYSFEGSLTNSSIDNSYVLNTDGNAFELQQGSIEIQPFSAVIKATAAQSGAPKKSLYITGGSATGIYNVTPETEVKSSTLYNLKGQRVSKPVKGTIYIKDGKKYMY